MRKSECRRGEHDYKFSTVLGAGLRRASCGGCGTVTIDITDEQAGLNGPPNLFVGEEDRLSIFGGGIELDLRPLPV